MQTLFALMPDGLCLATLFEPARGELAGARAQLQLVTYGPAQDHRHLLSLVRARRDPLATRWLRGLLVCIGAGAAVGMLANGILAGAFGMLGGLLEIALPLGLVLGAFLGGFTAAMTGTEVARDEVRRLVHGAAAGSTLLQASAAQATPIAALRARCEALGLPSALRS